MSKYIIEIPDDVPFVLLIKKARGKFITKVVPVAELEELNSDYINENFGELQNEAYQRGINDGSLDVKQRVEGAYQRGLEDAWEAARKIIHMPEGDLLNIFTECYSAVCTALQVLLKYDASEAIAKLKTYEDKQSDRIEVGDIVERYVDGKLDSKGIYLQEDGGYWRCLFDTGAVLMTFAYPKGQFKKTGKHYDIQSILEAMRTHD